MMPKVIVITGASGGIGAALAKRLGAQGHRLVLAARRGPELEQVARAAGAQTLAVVTDVTRRADVERLRDRALEKFGAIDVWVNNAGQGIKKKTLDLTDEDLDAMIAVNLKSALYGMQAVLPHFRQRGEGHIINMSSFLGRVPLVTERSAYSAAKAALNVLTANARADLKRENPRLRVSLVMPGVVLTDFHRNAVGAEGVPAFSGQVATQTADEVAALLADLIEHPRAELYTNPAQPEMAKRYLDDPAAFEGGR